MTYFPAEPGPGVSSELIDLGGISLTELRALKDAALHRSLRHVVEQTADIGVTSAGGNGGERVD